MSKTILDSGAHIIIDALDKVGVNFPGGFSYRVFEPSTKVGRVYISRAFLAAISAFGIRIETEFGMGEDNG